MSEDDAMADEFDVVPRWTADAVATLGPEHALPAACRGSGSPAALRWLCESMGLTEGMTLVDSGAGMGGPAELAAREYGVSPTLVEPMPGACRAAVRLFSRPTVVAPGERLPFASGSFDAAWSVGVLCTVEDKLPVLAELRRLVEVGAPVGFLVFVRTGETLPEQPSGNHFPTRTELLDLLGRSALRVTAEAAIDDFPSPSAQWQEALERLDEVLERDHGGDERYRSAGEQQASIGRLMGEGLVVGRLVATRAV